MKSEHMLMYALVFVLGFIVARMMGGRLVEGAATDYYRPTPEQGCQDNYFIYCDGMLEGCFNKCRKPENEDENEDECREQCVVWIQEINSEYGKNN